MIDATRAVNNWAILFFISLVVMGQIILLNLLLAVLLENFEEKRVQKKEMNKNSLVKKLKPKRLCKDKLLSIICCIKKQTHSVY